MPKQVRLRRGTTNGPDTVPVPYYALAYIMKL